MPLNYIANAFQPSASGRTLPVIDPSDGQAFDEIQRDVPCVAKFKPSSKFNMYDYYKAGGVGATMKASHSPVRVRASAAAANQGASRPAR